MPSCCKSNPRTSPDPTADTRHWITGKFQTPIGFVPAVSTRFAWKDRLGAWKVRWNIGRMSYDVEPGLYAVGNPSADSVVLVTANYKFTFDSLRRELSGIDAWILVLDTQGVNVWCAAGKGTFGTEELVNRIAATNLQSVVNHRRLILPQLGAPGVSAREVAKQSGFSVQYGPVRAKDIPEFLRSGIVTPQMRKVTFTLRERLAVAPVELAQIWKMILITAGVFFLAWMFMPPFRHAMIREYLSLVGSVFAGVVLTAAFLPAIPFKAFALKGLAMGLLFMTAPHALLRWPTAFHPRRIPAGPGDRFVLWR